MTRLLIFICCMFCFSYCANANNCRSISNTINENITQYSGQLEHKHFSWMDFSWLQKNLGAADSKKNSDGDTQYKWRCESGGSFIVATVDSQGKFVKIKGEYNSDQGSGLFSASIPESHEDAIPIQSSNTSAPVSVSDRVNQYNEHYQTSFKDDVDIEVDMIKKVKIFYSHLRECKPGTDEFALPVLQDFLFHTAIISPEKSGHCPVKITYVIPQIGTIDLKCEYQLQSLALFTDAEAESAARGITKFDSENPHTLQSINDKECKRYIDGVL